MKIKYVPSKDPRVSKFNRFIETNYPEMINADNFDIILVAGGDGAMHHTIHDYAHLNKVFFGKALGTFNFLMNAFENDKEIIDSILSDKTRIYTINTHSISVYLDGKYLGEAVNDVIVGGGLNDYLAFSISSKDKSFEHFNAKGLGLCISTDIGSTAFNFNNGGSILPLQCGLWSVTGVVCNRHINDIISSQPIEIKSDGAEIFLSGIYKGTLKKDSTLTISKGKLIKLGFLKKLTFQQKRFDLANRYRRE